MQIDYVKISNEEDIYICCTNQYCADIKFWYGIMVWVTKGFFYFLEQLGNGIREQWTFVEQVWIWTSWCFMLGLGYQYLDIKNSIPGHIMVLVGDCFLPSYNKTNGKLYSYSYQK
jgi:hypothetical protein